MDTVPVEQRDFMEEYLTKNEAILSLHAADVGKNTDRRFMFPIDVPADFRLPLMKPYPANPSTVQYIDTLCNKWLTQDVVEPSTAVGCFPIFCVKKKVPSGANDSRELIMKMRPVIDFRYLNRHVDAWPQKIPLLLHALDTLAGKTIFTKVDLSNAYIHLEIREQDRYLTTFITPSHNLYQFKRLPFGLKNAGTFFCFFLKTIMAELGDNALIYLDDILLSSSSIKEHQELLCKFGDIMKKYNLKISPKKCIFFAKEVDFLGFVVNGSGVKISEDKVKAIKEYQRPQTQTQVRSFLGMVNWVSRYIPSFQTLCAPLTNLTQKEAEFAWTQECEDNFHKLKDAVAKACMLHHPRFGAPFHIYTDASKVACGAGLFQVHEEAPQDIKDSPSPPVEWLRPVAFHARKFSSTQSRYSTLEQECLAILDSLSKFTYYLEFAPKTVLHTDAKTVLFLLSYNYWADNPKLTRYSMVLMAQPHLEVVHCPGKKNALADALSRQWTEDPKPPPRRSARNIKKEDIRWDAKEGTVLHLEEMIDAINENPMVVSNLQTL